MNSENPSHTHTIDASRIDPRDSYWHNLKVEFARDLNNPYVLTLAKLDEIKACLAELSEYVKEIEDVVREAGMK